MEIGPLLTILLVGLSSTISGARQIPEQVMGVVKEIGLTSLTVETPSRETATVLVTPKTRALMSNVEASITQVTVGDRVVILVIRSKAGTLTAREVAWKPRPVKQVQFSIATSPQEMLSMQVAFDPHSGFGANSRPGQQIVPRDGYVFLFVKASVSADCKVAVGRDFYLTDGGGEKTGGYLHADADTWGLATDGGQASFGSPGTAEFFYPVKKDRVVGSVFHFLDADFRVSDAPPDRRAGPRLPTN